MSKTSEGTVSVWVKLFVGFHLLAIVAWSAPRPQDDVGRTFASAKGTAKLLVITDRLRETPLKYYLLCTGLWQYWDMFAPNPANTNDWAYANVTYSDGHWEHIPYPRIETLPIPQKFIMERYRKFFERVGEANEPIRRRFAERMALIAGRRGDAFPFIIEVIHHVDEIQPPPNDQVISRDEVLIRIKLTEEQYHQLESAPGA
ncbi:MAG: hypothetical protein JSS72_02055 [Armatimonadetes bacterium]|nr:hypothetical protein [Armatimonadota bacterium]